MKFLLVLIVALIFSMNVFAQYNVAQTLQKRVLFDPSNASANLKNGAVGVYTIMSIPAKTAILKVSALTVTGVTGGDMEVGDSDNTDGYIETTFEDTIGFYPLKAAASTLAGAYQATAGGPDLGGGKYYASADTLDLKITGSTVTIGKIWFVIDFMKL
jgi:hypothetical protein